MSSMKAQKTRQARSPSEARGVAQREVDPHRATETGNTLRDSQRLAVQRRQLHASFGPAAQLRDGEPGPFAEKIEAGVDPQSLGLVPAQAEHALGDTAGAAQVFQLARWEDHGAKKINGIWIFKDEGKARLALEAELGASKDNLKEADWKLGIEFAMNREEGADSALKLMFGTAAENLRLARIAARKKKVSDAQLLSEIDGAGLGDIATRALKLGVTLYIEGNLNGGIGDSWTQTEVNDAIDELDFDNFELIPIPDKKEGDERTGIVIRDAHKASNKAQQGKGSIYRGVDVQANVNMFVLGKLVQVHLNVG